MKHLFREYMSTGVRPEPFHPFSPEEWSQQTSTMMRTFLVQHLPTPIGPQPVISGSIPSSKPTAYSPAALELMSFKKGDTIPTRNGRELGEIWVSKVGTNF